MQTRSITAKRKSDVVLAMGEDIVLSREIGKSCCAGYVLELQASHVSVQAKVRKKIYASTF